MNGPMIFILEEIQSFLQYFSNNIERIQIKDSSFLLRIILTLFQ